MFALTQTTGTYIYDSQGIELHHLDKSLGIEYLPYHFLLVLYDQKKLKYYDTTTGVLIADHIARNPYTVMRQNPSNAIIALGSAKGTVEWWTPGIGTPALKVFVGAGISDIGFYKGYMYTSAEDLKIWDSRTLKPLYTYALDRKSTSIELSQSGLLAINYGFKMAIYKDAHISKQTHPYMLYKPNTHITNCKFVPF
jgi:U3 small nucleolar RNA-associated protein 7